MAAKRKDRLHGPLDALILKTLSWGPRHGYAISRWLSDTSGEAIQVEEGSLYPALYRMERERWIEADQVDEELDVHLEMVTRDLIAQGRSEPDARAEARHRFGDVAAVSAR